jgi:hypothetical protein
MGALAMGCTGPGQPESGPTTAPPTGPLDARTRLAGLAAAAKDHRFVAGYTLTQPGRAARTVTTTIATDGTWRIDVPGGALGGAVDVSVVGARDGVYQCVRGSATSCVRAGGALPASADPRVQHVFTDWLNVLTDRQAALSVAASPALTGTKGSCFSVEPTAVSMIVPVDAGIYCYAADGMLTAARVGFGSLVLATAVNPAPATVTLPGPVVAGAPVQTAAPPPPPSASASASARR